MISAPVQAERLPVRYRAERELEDDDRQARHRRVHVQAQELVVQRGEQQRRGLAADAGDRQQDAGDDAGLGGPIGDLRIIIERAAGRSTRPPRAACPAPRISMSSVVRTTTGITITASATAPAQPEKCPIGADHDSRRRTGRSRSTAR